MLFIEVNPLNFSSFIHQPRLSNPEDGIWSRYIDKDSFPFFKNLSSFLEQMHDNGCACIIVETNKRIMWCECFA